METVPNECYKQKISYLIIILVLSRDIYLFCVSNIFFLKCFYFIVLFHFDLPINILSFLYSRPEKNLIVFYINYFSRHISIKLNDI